MPAGVDHGLQGKDLAAVALPRGALYFSGPCYCGVTGTWFRAERGAVARETVAPEQSFALAAIHAGVGGLFAGIDPDRGETNRQELEHLLATGGSIAEAMKSTYDDVVLARRVQPLALRRYEPGKPPPFQGIDDVMSSGGACRLVFGLPTHRPLTASAKDPFQVECKRDAGGRLAVLVTADASVGKHWRAVDVYRADGGWTHRLRFTLELQPQDLKRLGHFEVIDVTRDGQPLRCSFATTSVELWGRAVRLRFAFRP